MNALLSRLALVASGALLFAACAVEIPTEKTEQPTEATGTTEQADSAITGAQIVEFASRFDGYSYYWGHAHIPSTPGPKGTCHGSCGHCTHSGVNGGDCSGLAGKAWQLPSVMPFYDNDKHGPVASTYNGNWQYGVAVSTADIGPGDASSSSSHVVIISGVTRAASGAITGISTHECMGCAASLGCKANHRSKLLPQRSRRKGATAPTDTHTENQAATGNGSGGSTGSTGGGGATAKTCRLASQCSGSARFCCDTDGDGVSHCQSTSCTPKRADTGAACGTSGECPTTAPHCCDNDNDGKAHCSANVCRAKSNGSTKEQCGASTQCTQGQYPNCCDLDGDGVAHCVTATQTCNPPKDTCASDADCAGSVDGDHCCGGACSNKACACTHDVNTQGAALSPTCSSCTKAVCDKDLHCCTESWDLPCVELDVPDYCGGG